MHSPLHQMSIPRCTYVRLYHNQPPHKHSDRYAFMHTRIMIVAIFHTKQIMQPSQTSRTRQSYECSIAIVQTKRYFGRHTHHDDTSQHPIRYNLRTSIQVQILERLLAICTTLSCTPHLSCCINVGVRSEESLYHVSATVCCGNVKRNPSILQ